MEDRLQNLAKRLGQPTERQRDGAFDYREYVPASARAYISALTGQRTPITEKFFTPTELEILRQTAERASERQTNQIGYGDYGAQDPYAQGAGHLRSALFDRGGSLANTLGMARVDRDPSGQFVITDRYDFGATPEQMQQYRGAGGLLQLLRGAIPYGPMGVLNALGNYVAPQGEGRAVEIRLPPSRKTPEDR